SHSRAYGVSEPLRGLRRYQEEGHRLDQIEPQHSVRVALVGDGQVAADGELEVFAPQAHHHRTVHGRRPHDRAIYQLPNDVQHGIATIAHGLGEPGAVTRPHGDRVRAVHAGQAQESGRLRDAMRVGLIVVGDGQDGMGGALVDALDAARRVAVEDRGVLRVGDAGRRVDQGLKLRILGAALDGVHLLPREIEVRPQLDDGYDLPPAGLHFAYRT